MGYPVVNNMYTDSRLAIVENYRVTMLFNFVQGMADNCKAWEN